MSVFVFNMATRKIFNSDICDSYNTAIGQYWCQCFSSLILIKDYLFDIFIYVCHRFFKHSSTSEFLPFQNFISSSCSKNFIIQRAHNLWNCLLHHLSLETDNFRIVSAWREVNSPFLLVRHGSCHIWSLPFQ